MFRLLPTSKRLVMRTEFVFLIEHLLRILCTVGAVRLLPFGPAVIGYKMEPCLWVSVFPLQVYSRSSPQQPEQAGITGTAS